MLAAARAKLMSTSAPAITSTDDTPSLPKWPLSLAVFGSARVAVSTTISLPSAALADSAVRSASLRTFFGKSDAWMRAAGALLGVHLLGRRRDLGTALGLVRALLAARQLPHHAALQVILADGGAEHRVGEIDLAGAVALDGLDRDLH